jgi:hypothetical protein
MGRTTRIAPAPKQVDPYYLTPEHREWREKVIANAGGQCQAVDSTGKRCFKTIPHVRLFADHIVERQDGGDELDPRNGQALCGQHHTIKTAQQRAKRHGTTGTSA